MKTFDPKKTLFVIDGSSFLYRAYYGVRPLHTKTGEPVQAVYAFCRIIHKLIYSMGIESIAIAWDSKERTNRHDIFSEYKATRQAAPSDIFQQKERIIEFADTIHITQIAVPGIEADDIMFSLAKDREEKQLYTVLVTTDKDMGQALSPYIFMYDAFKEIMYDMAAFEEKMGFTIDRLPLYFALLGDSSDNIPGVKGIGKKTAQILSQEYSSLDELYANINNITPKRAHTALTEHKDDAYLSYKLFLLQYHRLDYVSDDFIFNKNDWNNAANFFQNLEFKSLLTTLTATNVKPVSTLAETIAYYKNNYNFILVTTKEQLAYVCSQIEQYKTFALDTETDTLKALESELAGISICVKEGEAFYIPCNHHNGEHHLTKQEVLSTLQHYLESDQYSKYLHNAKFDQLVFAAQGIELKGVTFDTMIAASLVTKDWQKIGLKSLSEHYLNEVMITFKDVVLDQHYTNFLQVPLKQALYYAANDAHQTFRLKALLEKELADANMTTLYYTIEHPISQILYRMEKKGIFCDSKELKDLGVHVDRALQDIDDTIKALLGTQNEIFNFNSPKQMRQLLFDILQLPPQKKSAKGKEFSTDKEVLIELAKIHPIPGLILKHRELFKLKSTYIDALPSYINPKTHTIHTTYNQTLVATGRLSSSEPNLQNIPADAQGFGIQVRQAFKPSPGYQFISADYSQIELRVLAQLSGDMHLRNAFLHGHDIHQETAARLFDINQVFVSHEQRQLGKRINFSILYGLTPYGLSKDLDISFTDAKKYIAKYFDQYPGVSEWMEKSIEQTKKQGFVTTYYGRRRYIPGIYEKNHVLYQEACRVAINTIAQGTAAEIIKIGMIQLSHALEQAFPEASIVLQIHDELLIEAPIKQVQKVEDLTKEILESVVQWSIPLIVTTRHGIDWKDVTK